MSTHQCCATSVCLLRLKTVRDNKLLDNFSRRGRHGLIVEKYGAALGEMRLANQA